MWQQADSQEETYAHNQERSTDHPYLCGLRRRNHSKHVAMTMMRHENAYSVQHCVPLVRVDALPLQVLWQEQHRYYVLFQIYSIRNLFTRQQLPGIVGTHKASS